jgi:hypothetical protein
MYTQPPAPVHHFAFVYATKNPLFVCLVRVHLVESVSKELFVHDWCSEFLEKWGHTFQIQVPDFVFSDEEFFQTEFIVEVLHDACKQAGGRIVSDADFVSLRSLS